MTDFEQVVALTEKLSLVEKVRLVRRVLEMLEQDILQRQRKSKRLLRGLWSDVDISTGDIDQARHETWRNFPREDI
jgi:hypothetical protein